jgi:hypothetical protein
MLAIAIFPLAVILKTKNQPTLMHYKFEVLAMQNLKLKLIVETKSID